MMTLTLKTLFWLLAVLVIYTYIGYGAILYILLTIKRLLCKGREANKLPADESSYPAVTLMICAYNEEDVAKEKMDNIRQLDYPKDKLCVMWVTDGSDDGTNDLLKGYPEVHLVFSPERRGKAAAMQHGLQENHAEYVIFTDANTMLNAESIKVIMTAFMDPSVGCVSGEKRVRPRCQGQVAAEGEGAYWKYESLLKRWDSELYSAMGAAGELFAVRMSNYCPAPSNALLDDFMISMLILRQRKRIAYTPDAYAMEYGSASMADESKRKRRIAAGGLQSVWWLRDMMNPLRHPVVAFQFVSHRVLRWTVTPFALLALLPLNIVLTLLRAGMVYDVTLILQAAFYAAALAGYILARRGRKQKLLYIPYYFLFMNLNVVQGIAYLRTHSHAGTWEKVKRA